MSKVLSQDEVDALLNGISDGEVKTETDTPPDTSALKLYDFSNQEKVVKGKMPVLELIGERFARTMRTSLSSSLRRPVGAKVLSHNMVKYGDFVKTLPLPISMHVLRMEPLRGPVLMMLESELIFCLVEIFFGGSGAEPYQVEGREFTTIENGLIKKVVELMLADLKEAWKNVQPVTPQLVRSEANPQFVTVVPSDEPTIIMGFELEINGSVGKVMLCFPNSALEPVKNKLQGIIQHDQSDTDSAWAKQFRYQLMEVPVEVLVELGRAVITGNELLNLDVGDVIQLDTYSKEKLRVKIATITKFLGLPGFYRGSQALQISNVVERRY